LESDITYLISRQEAELVLGVNNAAYHGDLFRLKGLISAGADPSKPDHDGRTALVCECDLSHTVITIQTSEVHFHWKNCNMKQISLCENMKYGLASN
jgi:ankyrin repeat protein